jgi:hypothetical protein
MGSVTACQALALRPTLNPKVLAAFRAPKTFAKTSRFDLA